MPSNIKLIARGLLYKSWFLQSNYHVAKRLIHSSCTTPTRLSPRASGSHNRPPNRESQSDPADMLQPIDVTRPHRLFPQARRIRRKLYLHIGPTNSGKSHTALESFKRARRGFYAGPLRMLAREIFDRMADEGVACNLVTGDEVLEVPGATLNSGTVEMMDVSSELDVAVIDEIQMIEDRDRGWAWTRALLGVRAREVHLCGDPNSESIISRVAQQTGDHLIVRRYERLSPLEVEPHPLVESRKHSLLQALQPGDALVCFSKKEVRAWRDKIVQAHSGKMCCAIVYGSLPPETRAEQAKLFNDPGNGVDYLVASDAIGMGLNLAIRRVVFSTLKKFDGQRVITLPVPQIKQIAGRAGRFGHGQDEGLVNCIVPAEKKIIRKALRTKSPEIRQAVCMPPDRVIRAATLNDEGDGTNHRFSRMVQRVSAAAVVGKDYCRPRHGTMSEVAALYDSVWGLTFEDRLRLCNAPVPTSTPEVRDAFVRMCRIIGDGHACNILQILPELRVLERRAVPTITLEGAHKILTLFLWLSYRFPSNFVDREGATDLKRLAEHKINQMLTTRRTLDVGTRSPRPKPNRRR